MKCLLLAVVLLVCCSTRVGAPRPPSPLPGGGDVSLSVNVNGSNDNNASATVPATTLSMPLTTGALPATVSQPNQSTPNQPLRGPTLSKETVDYVVNGFLLLQCPFPESQWVVQGTRTNLLPAKRRFNRYPNSTLRISAVPSSVSWIECRQCSNFNDKDNNSVCTFVHRFNLNASVCSRDYCSSHGECVVTATFDAPRPECLCDHGYVGEQCEHPYSSKFFLAVAFWLMIILEVSSLMFAVLRHQRQTIFKRNDGNSLRFVDVLNNEIHNAQLQQQQQNRSGMGAAGGGGGQAEAGTPAATPPGETPAAGAGTVTRRRGASATSPAQAPVVLVGSPV